MIIYINILSGFEGLMLLTTLRRLRWSESGCPWLPITWRTSSLARACQFWWMPSKIKVQTTRLRWFLVQQSRTACTPLPLSHHRDKMFCSPLIYIYVFWTFCAYRALKKDVRVKKITRTTVKKAFYATRTTVFKRVQRFLSVVRAEFF